MSDSGEYMASERRDKQADTKCFFCSQKSRLQVSKPGGRWGVGLGGGAGGYKGSVCVGRWEVALTC